MEEAKTIVVGERIHRPLVDYTVTEDDWKKAEVELHETPETRAACLKALKKLLTEQTDFTARTDDSCLMIFLRVRKFDVDRTFKLMKDHYKFRAKYPDVFPSPSSIEKALKANIFSYLSHRDHLGRSIFVVKMAQWNPEEVSYSAFVAAGNIVSEYVLDNPVTQINGYTGIWDFKGFRMKHFVEFCSPKNIILLTTLMQDRFPGRFKIAYCVNCSSLVQTSWNLFKVVMKEKFKNRVKLLTSDMSTLHQFIDPSILPVEYGGVMPPSNCKEIVQRVLDKEEYFNYDRKFGYKS